MDKGTFIPSHPLKTAVLFLVFNRLDTTKQVFEVIRQAKPPRLYIASDGPRENIDGEDAKVKAVREFVISHIDWDCKVLTLFREKNLGCKYGLSSSITWFFENEEMGIILEDDGLVSLSFFWFCEELLSRYKDDERIWHISSYNFQDGIKRGNGSYYFSANLHGVAWATWKSRWMHFDVEMDKVSNANFLKKYFKRSNLRYWQKTFYQMKKNKFFSVYDYQWYFTMLINGGLTIVPNVNMITNIGYGKEATHTIDMNDPLANMPRFEIGKIIHPDTVQRCFEADEYEYKKYYAPPPMHIRIINKLKRILK